MNRITIHIHIIYIGRNEDIPSKFNFRNDNINSQPFSFPDCSLLFEVIIFHRVKSFSKQRLHDGQYYSDMLTKLEMLSYKV